MSHSLHPLSRRAEPNPLHSYVLVLEFRKLPFHQTDFEKMAYDLAAHRNAVIRIEETSGKQLDLFETIEFIFKLPEKIQDVVLEKYLKNDKKITFWCAADIIQERIRRMRFEEVLQATTRTSSHSRRAEPTDDIPHPYEHITNFLKLPFHQTDKKQMIIDLIAHRNANYLIEHAIGTPLGVYETIEFIRKLPKEIRDDVLEKYHDNGRKITFAQAGDIVMESIRLMRSVEMLKSRTRIASNVASDATSEDPRHHADPQGRNGAESTRQPFG